MRTSMRDLISRLQKAVTETAQEQAQLNDDPVGATPASQTRAESPPMKPRSPRSPRNMSPATQGSPGSSESPTPRLRSSNQMRTMVSASTVITVDSVSRMPPPD